MLVNLSWNDLHLDCVPPQGIAAEYLSYVMLFMPLPTNQQTYHIFLVLMAKKWLKSVYIYGSYCKIKTGYHFLDHSVYANV